MFTYGADHCVNILSGSAKGSSAAGPVSVSGAVEVANAYDHMTYGSNVVWNSYSISCGAFGLAGTCDTTTQSPVTKRRWCIFETESVRTTATAQNIVDTTPSTSAGADCV